MEPAAALGLLTIIGVGALTMGYANKETTVSERKGTEVPYIETKVIQSPGEELLRQVTCAANARHPGSVTFMTEDIHPRCPICRRYQ